MRNVQKDFQFTLRTLAPVHIGSGKTYTQKEYIYENSEYYFPDMGLLYQQIQKQGKRVTDAFESFLMNSGNRHNRQKPRLNQFLREQKISSRDFGGYKLKETGLELSEGRRTPKGHLNEISAFITDSYGLPYIPGSSLKGAIRTILVNQHFHGDTRDTISWGAQKDTPFSDIFHHIRVSDSQPLSTDNLMLAQKLDYSSKKMEAKPLPIHRICLKPLTVVKFTISAVGEEAISLISQLGDFSDAHYQEYHREFLSLFPEKYIQQNIQHQDFYPFYLGAGSGFWTKTYMKKADPSRHKDPRSKMQMEGKGVLKLTKAQNKRFKVQGDIYSLVENNEQLFEMGKCNFMLKEQ